MTSAATNNGSNNCIYCGTWQFSSVFPPPLSLVALACVWKLRWGGNKADVCLTPGVSDLRATPTTAAGDLTLSINTPICTCTRGENTPKWQATQQQEKPLFLPLKAAANAGRETQASQGERKVFLHLFPRLKALIKRLLNSSTSSPPRPASCHHFFSFLSLPPPHPFHSRHLVFDGPCLGEKSRLVGDLWRFTVNFLPSARNSAPIFCSDMKGCFAEALFQEIKCNKNNDKKKKNSCLQSSKLQSSFFIFRDVGGQGGGGVFLRSVRWVIK